MELNGTYYAGGHNKQPGSFALDDIDLVDIACVVLLFASWIGLFLRYGFGAQSIAYVVAMTLLVAAGIFERKAARVTLVIPALLVVVWVPGMLLMPYGTGPLFTAAGAGGTVPFFSALLGVGVLPVVIDSVLGVLVMLLCSIAMYVLMGLLTGKSLFNPGVPVLCLAVSLYMGSLGSLVFVGITLLATLVIALLRNVLPMGASSGFGAPMFYSNPYLGGGDSADITFLSLGIALASAVIFLFL